MEKIAVVCFLWNNTDFRSQYSLSEVLALKAMIDRLGKNTSFYCVTNETGITAPGITFLPLPLPNLSSNRMGCWPALYLFSRDLQNAIQEDCILKLDLDSVITGNIFSLLNSCSGKLQIWVDPNHKLVNPSFCFFRKPFGQDIWSTFQERVAKDAFISQDEVIEKYGWDQWFLNICLTLWNLPHTRLTDKHGIYSRKEVEKTLPENSKIVFFNGSHNPWHERMKRRYPWIKKFYGC